MISPADLHWMKVALRHAHRCLRQPPLSSDVPVGAVCVLNKTVLSAACNMRELRNDPAAHAEIIALQRAARLLNVWQLQNVTLYVTLEPCCMCAGAIWQARVGRVVFGAWDEKAGACGSIYDVPRDPRLNYQSQLRGGVMEKECQELLRKFFQMKRNRYESTFGQEQL